MEVGVLGEVVAYLVEEEAGRELVQTLPQPMEEMIVWDHSVKIVTPKTVEGIQIVLLMEDVCLDASVFFPSSTGAPCITVVPRGAMLNLGAQLAPIEGDSTFRTIGDIVPRTVKEPGLKNHL